MVIFAGQTNVVNFGPRENPVRDKYWADRGLIHYENTEENTYETMTVRQFLQRLRAVSDMLGNSRATMSGAQFAHSDEIQRQLRFVEQAADMAAIAKEQGMPSDPSARADLKRRRSKTVAVAQGKYSF